jgi:hypothetical protein
MVYSQAGVGGLGGVADEQTALTRRENRARRAIARLGLFLSKSSRRDRHAADFGCWYVINLRSDQIIAGGKRRMSLADIEGWMARQARQSRSARIVINADASRRGAARRLLEQGVRQ